MVSRPCSMWSSVATVRASMAGCISPQRTAVSRFMRCVCGAIAAAKLSVSCPTWNDDGHRMLPKPSASARSTTSRVWA